MAKIILQRTGCIGCGACASVCPSFFEMAKDGLANLKGGAPKKNGDVERTIIKTDRAAAAVKSCPVNVIHLKK